MTSLSPPRGTVGGQEPDEQAGPATRMSIVSSAAGRDRHVDAITIRAIPGGGELDHPLGGTCDPLLHEQWRPFGDAEQPGQVRVSRLGAYRLLAAGRHHSVVA